MTEQRKLAALGVLGKGGYDQFVAPWIADRDRLADALAASQEKLERANEDRREVQRVLQAQLQASQEKKWQAEFDNGRLVGELAASQEKERAYEEAAREVVALYRGWRLREPEGRAAIKRLAKLAGLDSTQTHGGSNA